MPTAAAGEKTRFIPAGAGNTARPRSSSPWRPVHPRGCGEHETEATIAVGAAGSSPRVRGTHFSHFTDNSGKKWRTKIYQT